MSPRVVVVGCGWWGQNLVRNFHRLGALRAVVEPGSAGQARARELAPDVPVYASLEEAPADAGLVLATPAATHYELSREALRAGRDVFVEKPLALRTEQGRELVDLAARQGRILMVGHVLEYHPAIGRMLELIRSGTLGNLHYLYSNRLSLGKVRREENILYSFAPHDIAVILRLTGEMPRWVSASGGIHLQPDIADITLSHLSFASGIQGHIFVSWLNPFKEQRLVVVGSQRMAVFDDVRKRLELYDQRIDLGPGDPVPIKGEMQLVDFAPDEPLALECRAFLEAMETRRPPLSDAESGLRVLQVLEACQASLERNGAPVTLE